MPLHWQASKDRKTCVRLTTRTSRSPLPSQRQARSTSGCWWLTRAQLWVRTLLSLPSWRLSRLPFRWGRPNRSRHGDHRALLAGLTGAPASQPAAHSINQDRYITAHQPTQRQRQPDSASFPNRQTTTTTTLLPLVCSITLLAASCRLL